MTRCEPRYTLEVAHQPASLDMRARPSDGRGSSAALIGRVARSGAAAFIVYSLGVSLTYCSQLVIARIVGVETYGLYAYVLAWMVVLTYLSTLGFEIGLLRFVPAYETVRDWRRLKGVVQYAHRRVTLVSLSVALIGVGVVLSLRLSPAFRDTFLTGFALVPILALLFIRCSVVRAFGGVVSAVAPDRVVRDGVLIGLLLIPFFLGWGLSAPLVMAATLFSAAVGLGCATFALHRYRRHFITHVTADYDAPAWRRAVLPLVVLGSVEALLNRTGVILLGWLADTKSAGIYSLVFNIAFVVALPRIAVNTLFAPTVSSLYARNDMQTMQALVAQAALWTLLAGAGIGIVLFVIAEPFLSWFGPGYEAGAPALRILLVGQVVAAAAGSQLFVMTMTGQERSAAVLLTASTVFNASVSAVLVAKLGLEGAALGTAATLIVWNVAMAFPLWRRLGLRPGVFGMYRRQGPTR